MARFGRHGFWLGLWRLVQHRLITPLKRGRHSPEFAARGVAVGLFVAMTPTVGIQMLLVLGLWALVKAIHRDWDFGVLLALLWTWVTNAFTLVPVYYLFFVTGQVMLGHIDDITGYASFSAHLKVALDQNVGWFQEIWVYLVTLVETWGVPMFLGSLPWAALSAWLGYVWSVRFVRRYQDMRRRQRAKKLAKHRAII